MQACKQAGRQTQAERLNYQMNVLIVRQMDIYFTFILKLNILKFNLEKTVRVSQALVTVERAIVFDAFKKK
jgi:hypothetical protein